MTDDKQLLRVGYDGPWDTELDSDLSEVLAKHGYVWYESSQDLISGRRDLYFERPARADEAVDEDVKCP